MAPPPPYMHLAKRMWYGGGESACYMGKSRINAFILSPMGKMEYLVLRIASWDLSVLNHVCRAELEFLFINKKNAHTDSSVGDRCNMTLSTQGKAVAIEFCQCRQLRFSFNMILVA